MTDEQYLRHYGIPGMRWGRRKAKSNTERLYRNASNPNDKSLYRDSGRKDPNGRPVYVKVSKPRRMSNKELQSRVKRLELEKKFRDLSAQPATPSKIDKLVKNMGTISELTKSAATIYENVNKISKLANGEPIKKKK